jgi:hypothetical protein
VFYGPVYAAIINKRLARRRRRAGFDQKNLPKIQEIVVAGPPRSGVTR